MTNRFNKAVIGVLWSEPIHIVTEMLREFVFCLGSQGFTSLSWRVFKNLAVFHLPTATTKMIAWHLPVSPVSAIT